VKTLEDVRILALEQYGAGPFGSLHLADLGAEVIKIETPQGGGDVGRYVSPFAEEEDSLFFESFNRNKRSLSLDITNQAGRQVFEDLVARSDVVFSNLRGDVPEKLKIRYDDLKHCNPAIVCCSLTGFGMTSPSAKEPAYDYVMQGIAGWMDVAGEPDGAPSKTGLSMVDYAGGYVADIALLSALHAARRDGVGCDCDVSLYDTAISLLTYLATWHLTEGYIPQRTRHSAHPSLVPFQNFATADGWLVAACAKDKFWERLTTVLELPELAADARFATFVERWENKAELIAILEKRFRTRTTAEWLGPLRAAGVPCAPVNTVSDALADPLITAREMIVETEHPRFGTVRQVASAVRVGAPGHDRPTYRRAPQRNEDADYVLGSVLGYTPRQSAVLHEGGAFGDSSPAQVDSEDKRG
jgi:crotonobetainyl-CoA:carnitine CoA-transferase CaiB-like acyl-CoA transferase